jgi:hypothetical protein
MEFVSTVAEHSLSMTSRASDRENKFLGASDRENKFLGEKLLCFSVRRKCRHCFVGFVRCQNSRAYPGVLFDRSKKFHVTGLCKINGCRKIVALRVSQLLLFASAIWLLLFSCVLVLVHVVSILWSRSTVLILHVLYLHLTVQVLVASTKVMDLLVDTMASFPSSHHHATSTSTSTYCTTQACDHKLMDNLCE